VVELALGVMWLECRWYEDLEASRYEPAFPNVGSTTRGELEAEEAVPVVSPENLADVRDGVCLEVIMTLEVDLTVLETSLAELELLLVMENLVYIREEADLRVIIGLEFNATILEVSFAELGLCGNLEELEEI